MACKTNYFNINPPVTKPVPGLNAHMLQNNKECILWWLLPKRKHKKYLNFFMNNC